MNQSREDLGLVSIIVPVYNGENFVEQALVSIQKQSYKKFEVLVIDDGSLNPQFLPNLLRHIGDPRFKVYRKANGGVASALNFGIREARGQFFCWLSHDDLWTENKLALQISQVTSRKILCSNYYVVNESGEITGITSFENEHDTSSGLELISRGIIHGCSVFFEMQLFREVGLFDETLFHTQDYDFWLRAYSMGVEFDFEKKPLVFSRVHSAQTSRTVSNRIEVGLLWNQIVDVWFSQLKSQQLSEKLMLIKISDFLFFLQESKLLYAYELLGLLEQSLLNKFKVSVVIPVMDRPYSLQRCLNSLLAQTHRNFEVIIIDDSERNIHIESIVKYIEDRSLGSFVRVMPNTKKGISNARNLGISYSTGDYVAFLDSDDFYLPEAINSALKLITLKDSLFYHSNYIESVIETSEIIFHDTSVNSGTGVLKTLIDKCTIATSTVFVSRSSIGKFVPEVFDPSINIGEDNDAWIRLIAIEPKRMCHNKKPLTVVSTSKQSHKHLADEVQKVIQRNLESVISHGSLSQGTFGAINRVPLLLRSRRAMMECAWKIYLRLGRPSFLRKNSKLKKIFIFLRGF